ncbi:MAG: ferrochelatase [Planctomycetota bacterium]|nr:MAG: ferrochelatase [Planctomycetota bacterium]
MSRVDSVLLCGFGGPTPGCCGRRIDCPQQGDGFEADCFVRKILGDDPNQESRVLEVVEHYRHFGGYSPYNDRSEAQRSALESTLAQRGMPLRVALGFRNWPPWYSHGLEQLHQAGCRNTILSILAPHQGKRSWDDYIDEAHAARAAMPHGPTLTGVAAPLYDHSDFIGALAERVNAAAQQLSGDDWALVMTAHAIPQPAERGQYRPQVEHTADLLRRQFPHRPWYLGFQSAPSSSRIPWSQPVVEDCLSDCARDGIRRVVVIAIGFLVDHIEVRFDLDVELAEHAQHLGLEYQRARCVEDHPRCISAMADQIIAAMQDHP